MATRDDTRSREELLKEIEKLRKDKFELEILNAAAMAIEQRLEESEEQYRSVTETSIDAIITSDAEGNILTFNKGAKRMFGYDNEIVGQNVSTLIPVNYRARHQSGMRHFLMTGAPTILGRTVEYEALDKKGRIFPIELSLTTWESHRGRFFGAIIRDISERKRIEHIRENVQRVVRHDLKSPLIGITGMAGQLLKRDLPAREQEYAQIIQELGQKMLNSLNRSMDLFKMEQGCYELNPESFDLAALADAVARELAGLAAASGVSFAFEIDGRTSEPGADLPAHNALGETELMRTLLENLIKNAVEAAPSGSSVSIAIKANDQAHLIDIHNQGVVPLEVRETFFEPYSTCGKPDGTGLGTHSAMLVARTHGGTINFTTSEEEGTHLLVTLPRDPGTAAPQPGRACPLG